MARERESPVVHIGYPKTGSSWIQKYLFDNPSMGFAPVFGSDSSMRAALLSHIVIPKPLVFDPNGCSEYFSPAVIDVLSNGLVPVLSHERLAGTPHSGGYDSKELANRLAQLFPSARVLIVVREQRSMITSSYKQYVRNGGACSLGGYLHPPRYDGRIPLFDFEYFKYHRLVRHYVDLFGDSSVLVLPYEQFRNDPTHFVSRIARFAGAETQQDLIETLPYSSKENVAFSGLSIALKRILNRIVARRDSENPQVLYPISRRRELQLERMLSRVDSIMPRRLNGALDQRIRTKVSKEVNHTYGESNRVLAEIMGIDLERYGYEVR